MVMLVVVVVVVIGACIVTKKWAPKAVHGRHLILMH
jgi:hypothetical protein